MTPQPETVDAFVRQMKAKAAEYAGKATEARFDFRMRAGVLAMFGLLSFALAFLPFGTDYAAFMVLLGVLASGAAAWAWQLAEHHFCQWHESRNDALEYADYAEREWRN